MARRLNGTLAELAALGAVAAFIVIVPGSRALEFLATPLFALIVLVFAGEQGLVSRLMTTRPAAALGRWSYSIYMVHTFVLAALFSAVHALEGPAHHIWTIRQPGGQAILDLGSPLANDLSTLGFLVMVVVLSALTYRFIERPGQTLFARLGARKPAVSTAPAA